MTARVRDAGRPATSRLLATLVLTALAIAAVGVMFVSLKPSSPCAPSPAGRF